MLRKNSQTLLEREIEFAKILELTALHVARRGNCHLERLADIDAKPQSWFRTIQSQHHISIFGETISYTHVHFQPVTLRLVDVRRET